MNLYELAQRKQLPKFQQMDSPTLDWIRAHRPDLGGWRYSDICSTLTAGPEIPVFEPSWFLEPRVADGLHGTRHALRVALYVRALAAEQGLSSTERRTVIASALLHEIGRLHDQGDTEHGARGANWVNDHGESLSPLLELSATDCATVALAILGHEIPYPGVEREPGYAAAGWAIDLLKTADVLDRYRLPKTKWWQGDAFLKLLPSAALKSFAFDLVVESERRFLSGTDSVTSVLGAYAELITACP
jgi:hypothetical protein